MRTRTKRLPLKLAIGLLAVCFPALEASAGVILTQTRSDSGALFSLGINSLDQAQQGIYQFSKFDPSLGTLTAIEVDLSSNVLNRITSDGGRADFTTTVQFAVGATSGSAATAVNNVIGSGPGFPGATTPLPAITLSPGDLLNFVGTGPIDVSATVSQALANLSTFSCGTNFFGVPLTCHSQFRSELLNDVARIRYHFDPSANPVRTWTQTRSDSGALFSLGINSLDQAQQGIYQFSKFDPSLGTLMAVEVDLSSNVLNRITSDGGRADFTTTVQFAVGATSGSTGTAVNNVIGSGPGFPGATTPLPVITLSPGDLLDFVGTGPIDVSATVSQALANLSTFSCGTNFFGVPLTCHSQFRSELVDDVAEIRYIFSEATAAAPAPPSAALVAIGLCLLVGYGFTGRAGSRS